MSGGHRVRTRNFAHRLGGDFELESRLGEGAEFTLTVPAKLPATSSVVLRTGRGELRLDGYP